MGGRHEHQGDNRVGESDGEVDGAIDQQWHDVKVIKSEDGSQELVIENLENLQDTTALIVTRDEVGNFKIGIQQDNVSDVVSQARST